MFFRIYVNFHYCDENYLFIEQHSRILPYHTIYGLSEHIDTYTRWGNDKDFYITNITILIQEIEFRKIKMEIGVQKNIGIEMREIIFSSMGSIYPNIEFPYFIYMLMTEKDFLSNVSDKYILDVFYPKRIE